MQCLRDSRMVGLTRVGLEYKKCRKCGARYRTPDKEWRDMTRGQRVGYFVIFSGATILHLYVHGDFVFRRRQIRLAISGYDCSDGDGFMCSILAVEAALG